jgi:integrase
MILRVSAKGGIRREVTLPESSVEALERWLKISPSKESRWVFPAGRGSSFMDAGGVNKILTKHCKLAGVPHVHPHGFRATYATAAFDAGIPLREIQENLFHASPLTSVRYDRGSRGAGVPDAVAKHRAKKKDEDVD